MTEQFLFEINFLCEEIKSIELLREMSWDFELFAYEHNILKGELIHNIKAKQHGTLKEPH